METNREPSSSSLKRSISVDANANDSFNPIPHSNHLSTLSISDSNDEIDSYMAEQNATETPESTTTGPIPGTKLPIDGSKKLSLENLNKGPMQPGETWYLVSTHWYKRWKKACSGEVDKEGPLEEKDLGPVDNSSIIDENGGLNPLAVQGVDFEFVNASIWPLFESWYILWPEFSSLIMLNKLQVRRVQAAARTNGHHTWYHARDGVGTLPSSLQGSCARCTCTQHMRPSSSLRIRLGASLREATLCGIGQGGTPAAHTSRDAVSSVEAERMSTVGRVTSSTRGFSETRRSYP
jgi:hypothetical protein